MTAGPSVQNLKENVLKLCRSVACSNDIVAACLYGSQAYGYPNGKGCINVLLVLGKSRFGLKFHAKSLGGIDTFILVVDQKTLEKDVKQGWLGEFIAEKITVPYEPIVNEEYLKLQEVITKKRIVWELLENIVLEYPELSYEILIKIEYFIFEVMRRRARLFPLMVPSYLNMLRDDLKERNVESMMKGYVKALDELSKEGWISSTDGLFRIKPNFIDAVKCRKPRIPIFFKAFQRMALYNILSIFPSMMVLLIHEEAFTKAQLEVKPEGLSFELEDPKKHLIMQTPFGFVTLSDKTTIEDFARKNVQSGKALDFKIREIGGVLNDVYILSFYRAYKEQKVLVKKFRDWYGIKWFPLTLWALGTKTFAVLGRSRLEREVATNQFLHSQGILVPKILYVSSKQRLIFEDFVEGENLIGIIKQISSSEKEFSLMRDVGKEVAKVHKLGLALGDCKPENILVAGDRKIWFVDLEQGTRNGNQEWDIAEFLYYSGHYFSPLSPTEPAELIAREFISGYLEAGGKKDLIRKAGSTRYTKVFSIFTPPHILIAISNLCKKMGAS